MALSPTTNIPFGLNLPASVRISGGQIAPHPLKFDWVWVYYFWDTIDRTVFNGQQPFNISFPLPGGLWNNWIKPSIDVAKALGFNCVSLVGGYTGTVPGASFTLGQPNELPAAFTEQYLIDRWLQIADYCKTHGMYLYPREGQYPYTDITAFAAFQSRLIAALRPYWDIIIGMDISSEYNLQSASNPAAILQMIDWGPAPFRGTAAITLTQSSTNASGMDTAKFQNVTAFSAFIDIHHYTQGFGTSDSQPMNEAGMNTWPWSQYLNYQLIIGESGLNKNGPYDQRLNWLQGMYYNNANINNPLWKGCFMWSLANSEQGDFGILGYGGLIGADTVVPYGIETSYSIGILRGSSKFGVLNAPGTPYVNDNDHRIYSSPLTTSDTFDYMKVYRNGTVLASNLPVGRYDDSTERSKSQNYYQFSVVNAAASESALSAKTIVPLASPSTLKARGIQRTKFR